MKHAGTGRDSRPSPRISVITVVLDDLPGLMATHESLRRQTYDYVDWIIIDGGSADGTRDYLDYHHQELYWWRSQPDGGIYDAMNCGMAAAAGDYLLFLNAGDTLPDSDTLAFIASAAERAGRPDLVYGNSWERSRDGRILEKRARRHRAAWTGMFTHHQAILYRRAILDGLAYDTRYRIGADYALTLDVLARIGTSPGQDRDTRILRLDHPVCVYAPAGRSARLAAEGRRDQFMIRRRSLRLPLPVCAGLWLAQSLSWGLRQAFPAFFEALRFRPLPSPMVASCTASCTHKGLTSQRI
jgi:putative colanic acid biosynthesis glycosyltransferase